MAKPRLIGLDSKHSTRAKRDPASPAARPAMFVVQKHAAHRAGLHWDFRLEHGGVLWSWAVPKGPSLDPADRRMAIHVEDHPVEYGDFQGTIPEGSYGAGAVELWDRGTWEPLIDPEQGMREGHLKFNLSGRRLHGRFTLARLHRHDERRQEAWFLIKADDAAARAGVSAPVLEQEAAAGTSDRPPAAGAVRGEPPDEQRPQLATLVEAPPEGEAWLSEIKFDGYRLLIWLRDDAVRLVTRNGHDWTNRLPAVARAARRLGPRSAVLDGELVAMRPDGTSSFPDLQQALASGRDAGLSFYVFDLLAVDGWDLRGCALRDRKAVLETLADWSGMFRYSAHVAGHGDAMRRNACRMHLEGIVCKQGDAPYCAGRGQTWVKLKCVGREELIVLGWTPSASDPAGIGALHLGYFDRAGALHYAGGVGTGFSDSDRVAWRTRLEALAADPPAELLLSGDPLDKAIHWVRPDIVVEVRYTAWSGAGRVRHPVFLGEREDKSAADVVRDAADPDAERSRVHPGAPRGGGGRRRWKAAVPPVAPAEPNVVVRQRQPPEQGKPARIVVARPYKAPGTVIGGVELSHPDREVWPGISKRQLAEYWMAVADHALPGLAKRPLAIVRCPDGTTGEHFFQKNGHGHLPLQIREGSVSGSPYLAIDDASGLVALAQMSAVELHPWGARETDPLRPDLMVFDLDPGEGVAFDALPGVALEVRDRLRRLGLTSYCRTTGGKGLHVVVPLTPAADWDTVKRFCRGFAETMAADEPNRFLAHLKIADRRGRILIDWLRNGMGATAVASFCPRARPGASVATPLAWTEVKPGLDPSAFSVLTLPDRLRRLKQDPWHGFAETDQRLPDIAPARRERRREPTSLAAPAGRGTAIVVARRPRRAS